MATKRYNQQNKSNMPDVPEDLAEGETFSVVHTVQKNRVKPTEEPQGLSEEDLTDADWYVEVQTEDGWAFKDEVEGRPIEPELRDSYGHGRYRITPVINGQKLKSVRRCVERNGVGA